jgi:casein kinase 1
MAEEFNKYLSYVRNLGFEDTPDYDYLRELFTQALKNTGEVEDGEYDWMKINNGKGWEAMKQHPSAAHLNHGLPNSSAREIHGQRPAKNAIPHDRLNADLPKPGATRPAQGAGRHPQRRGESGGYAPDPTKRQSVQDFRHPEGSTVAQFQHSQQNLQPRNSTIQPPQMQAAPQQQQATPRGAPEEQKPTFAQKMLKLICCA